MTTFEEDIVDLYYNLNDYFTIKNIPFQAIKKRRGGAGRGEIDILAVQTKKGKINDCSHIEVSFSRTDKFPHADSGKKIIKKFFSEDCEERIKDIIGDIPDTYIMITSSFKKDVKKRLRNRLGNQGTRILELVGEDKGNTLILKLVYKGRTKTILIYTFEHILFKLMEIFDKQNLLTMNFQDPRLRAIQHYIHLIKRRDNSIKKEFKKKGNLDFL